MRFWSAFLTALFGATVACSTKDRATQEEPPSRTADPEAPALSWYFPKTLEYRVLRAGQGGARREDHVIERLTRDRTEGAERRVTVMLESRHDGELTFTEEMEYLVNADGVFMTGSLINSPGKPEKTNHYDPPYLYMPSRIEDGRQWKQSLADGTPVAAMMKVGSPFCADGLHIIRESERKAQRSRRTSHYCPKHGWRGTEIAITLPEGQTTWTATTDLVADGERWPDPPLPTRLPEAER